MKHTVPDEHRLFAKSQRRTATSAEAVLWQAVRAGRLCGWKFKRQVPYGPYVADLSCAGARLIVEVDGSVHDTDGQRARDAARDRWFEKRGFRVLRFANEMVLEATEFVLIEIQAALQRQASFSQSDSPSPGRLRRPPSP